MMIAARFACFFGKSFGNPGLYTVTVSLNEVLFYTKERHEQEFVVMLAKKSVPQAIPLPKRTYPPVVHELVEGM